MADHHHRLGMRGLVGDESRDTPDAIGIAHRRAAELHDP
jgi:hypothetical protein